MPDELTRHFRRRSGWAASRSHPSRTCRRVRIVKRSSGAPEGTELMQGDATGPEFLPGSRARRVNCLSLHESALFSTHLGRSNSEIHRQYDHGRRKKRRAAGGARKRVHAGTHGRAPDERRHTRGS